MPPQPPSTHPPFTWQQAELAERIARALPHDGMIEPLQGIHLARASSHTPKMHTVLVPSLCVIAQGSKCVFMGDRQYQYDPFHYLLVTLELPRTSQITQASPEQPYLSFRLELDPHTVGEVLAEAGHALSMDHPEVDATHVSVLGSDLLDAVIRLMRLLDAPQDARILKPLILREITYRLLMGAHGERLLYLTLAKSHSPHIIKVLEWLRQNFAQPIRMDKLAYELGMSVSSFHYHFKAVTGMSPLQYQKQLRLQEARRLLLLGEGLDTTYVAHQVGYKDATHFSREYKSLFGDPPRRDVQRLRAEHPPLLSDQ